MIDLIQAPLAFFRLAVYSLFQCLYLGRNGLLYVQWLLISKNSRGCSIYWFFLPWKQIKPISFIVYWDSCETTNNLNIPLQLRVCFWANSPHLTTYTHYNMYEYLSNYCKHNTTINSRYTVHFTQFYTDHVLGGSMSGLACVFQQKVNSDKKRVINIAQAKDGILEFFIVHKQCTHVSVTMTYPSQTPSSTTDSSE